MSMKCPKCGGKLKVFNARACAIGTWRRRRCPKCNGRFTSYEILIEDNTTITTGRPIVGEKHPSYVLNIIRAMLDKVNENKNTKSHV